MPICKAEGGDKYGIARLIHEDVTENNIYANSRINFDKVEDKIERYVSIPNEILIVHKTNDWIDGVILGTVFDLVWSDTIISSQQMVFVQKDQRGSSIFHRLIRAYISRSKELGATVVEMSNIIEKNIETSCSLFNRLGFKQVGTMHHMEV